MLVHCLWSGSLLFFLTYDVKIVIMLWVPGSEDIASDDYSVCQIQAVSKPA